MTASPKKAGRHPIPEQPKQSKLERFTRSQIDAMLAKGVLLETECGNLL